MNGRVLAGVVAGILALCCGGTAVLGGGLSIMSNSAAASDTGCGPGGTVTTDPGTPMPDVGSLSAAQLRNAAAIVAAGQQRNIPPRGWIIAVATALQESRLLNHANDNDNYPEVKRISMALPHEAVGHDHDSVGLLQQRPIEGDGGWGTVQELMTPTISAGKFYSALLKVRGWETLPLTEAAQAVQRSAYPDAYAKHEPLAAKIVDAVSGGAAPGCSAPQAGTAEPAPRNPDGSWPQETCSIRPDPTTGAGCVTPRLHHLVQQATAAGYPEPRCWRQSDHGEHPKGRACDWMMTAGGEATGAQKAQGDAMAAWAVANADRLGIMYVIWFRKIWTDDGRGWHAYNNPWGGNDPSGWHTNHVHISVHQ